MIGNKIITSAGYVGVIVDKIRITRMVNNFGQEEIELVDEYLCVNENGDVSRVDPINVRCVLSCGWYSFKNPK